jgi:hemolysin activation/secretion protein
MSAMIMLPDFMFTPKRSSLVVLACLPLCWSVAVVAQDLERVLPDVVPDQLSPLPAPASETGVVEDTLQAVQSILVAQPEEAVILESLRGVKLLTANQKVQPITTLGDDTVDVSGFPELQQDPEFIRLVKLFIGQPVSMESLQRLQSAVRVHFKSKGHSFTLVHLPQQDITDGYVQLVVTQARLSGEITVEGNRYFSDEQYLRWLRQQVDQPVDALQLNDDIDWINRNPFRSATVAASPGSQAGTTHLTIQAREARPVRWYMGANNTGSESTTKERVLAGMNWGNAFGLGHQMSLQVTADSAFEHSKSLSGSYSLDLPWRHTLSLSGAYSKTDGIVSEPFSLTGMSSQFILRYGIPLADAWGGSLSHSVSLGLDYKRSDNNFDFASIPITDNTTEVIQIAALYSGQLSDSLGKTSASLSLYHAPGGVTARNEDRYFKDSRYRASANYSYVRLDLRRNNRLPANWEWNWAGSGQLSNQNLIGSEQFGAGGMNTVRGYQEGEVYGDEGLRLSQELLTPAFAIARRLGFSRQDGMRLYVFQDFAGTHSVKKLPGEDHAYLHSAGLGLRYQIGQLMTAQVAWGRQLRNIESDPENHNIHFSVQFSY